MIATSFPGFVDLMRGLGADIARASVTPMRFVIAVDGPAASGKGTIAARLAARSTACRISTPACSTAPSGVRRAATRAAILDDEAAADAAARALDRRPAGRPGRCAPATAGEAASRVAVHPGGARGPAGAPARLRRASRAARCWTGATSARSSRPTPPAKLFVTATPEVRAERRWKQLTGQGEAVAYEDVLADIRRRDERDAGRGAAPDGAGRRRRLARHHRNDYRAGLRCGPPHRRGGARRGTVSRDPPANPTAPILGGRGQISRLGSRASAIPDDLTATLVRHSRGAVRSRAISPFGNDQS